MSVKKKVEDLMNHYKTNIDHNDSRLKYFKNDPVMTAKLNSESECLRSVIKELKEATKLKSQK